MTEKVKIKPLLWTQTAGGFWHGSVELPGPDGEPIADENGEYGIGNYQYTILRDGKTWCPGIAGYFEAADTETAKAACQAHWDARVLALLVEVSP
jgi:hypothetical protein